MVRSGEIPSIWVAYAALLRWWSEGVVHWHRSYGYLSAEIYAITPAGQKSDRGRP
jgi:hypothetical protein